jgi:hypothetical protein
VLAWRRARIGLCLGLLGHSAQVPPDLHSTFKLATQSPFVIAVEPPSTSIGGPTSSSLPVAGRSTSSSTVGWGRFFCASTAVRLDTYLMSVPSLDRAMLLRPRHRLSVSRRLWSVHHLQELVVPTSLRWRRSS